MDDDEVERRFASIRWHAKFEQWISLQTQIDKTNRLFDTWMPVIKVLWGVSIASFITIVVVVSLR